MFSAAIYRLYNWNASVERMGISTEVRMVPGPER